MSGLINIDWTNTLNTRKQARVVVLSYSVFISLSFGQKMAVFVRTFCCFSRKNCLDILQRHPDIHDCLDCYIEHMTTCDNMWDHIFGWLRLDVLMFQSDSKIHWSAVFLEGINLYLCLIIMILSFLFIYFLASLIELNGGPFSCGLLVSK